MSPLVFLLLAAPPLAAPACPPQLGARPQQASAATESGVGTEGDEETDEAPVEVLFQPIGEVATEGVRRVLDRIDPGSTEWRSEVMHELASHELDEFLAVVADPSSHRVLHWYLDDDFQGATPLVPRELVTLHDDGNVLVQGDGVIDEELRPTEELTALFRELMDPFQVDARRGWKVYGSAKIDSTEIEPGYPRWFETQVQARFIGRTEDERFCQVNTRWLLSWTVVLTSERESGVRLRKIELRDYQQIQAQRRFFAEVTAHLMEEVPHYEREFLVGAGEYHFRTDTLEGSPFSGRSGIAIGDVNADGREDLYVLQHGGIPNRLLLQARDGTLVDVTDRAGLDLLDDCQSALILDFDNDGDQDMAVSRGATLVVYANDGRGRFTPGQRNLMVPAGKITSLAAADWDLDGDLDLYACVYEESGPMSSIPVPWHDARNGPPNVAWRNDGDLRWTDVTAELGFAQNDRRFSTAALWEDFDQDGDPDLYVVNDFGRNNLYRNDDGRFTDVAREVGADDLASGMGVTARDLDLDGWVDLYVSNMWSSAGRRIATQRELFKDEVDDDTRTEYLRHARGNTLLLNRGDGTFEDATLRSGAENGGWAFGAVSIDINNDGLADLYSPNGFLTGKREDDL